MNVQRTGIARFAATTLVVMVAFVSFAIPKSADAAYQYGIGASICGNDPFMYCGTIGYRQNNDGRWQVGVGGTAGFGATTYSTSRPTYVARSNSSSVYTVGSSYSRVQRPVYVGSNSRPTYTVTSSRNSRTSYPNWMVMY